MPRRPHVRPRLLSHGRPPAAKVPSSLSSNATRSIIRKHHTLQKQLTTARKHDDLKTIEALSAQLAHNGGLELYQCASIQGQKLDRGGDTSKVLVLWMRELLSENDPTYSVDRGPMEVKKKLRLLEVGALSINNACSTWRIFEVERIDLHSQHPGIKQQDFMKRPLPATEQALEVEGFDIISLSLVVNYVGDAKIRGNMLRRVSSFLRRREPQPGSSQDALLPLPMLFLVLPASCVTNSRYLSEERLEKMMQSLGYSVVKKKLSAKLIYYLWCFSDGQMSGNQDLQWKKEEVRNGVKRNNFAIIL